MVAWWDGLSNLLRALYCIAIPATIILVLQTILSVAGGIGDGGEGVNFSDTSGLDLPDGGAVDDIDLAELGDGDPAELRHYSDGSSPGDGAALRLLTLQTVVAFLTVFSWTAIVSVQAGAGGLAGVLIGLVLGVLAMFLVAKMVQASAKLTENGTVDLQNALGESGKVYLPIPAAGQGEGKIMLQLQGSLRECEAITLSEQALPTGTVVRVTDLRNGLLVVEQEE